MTGGFMLYRRQSCCCDERESKNPSILFREDAAVGPSSLLCRAGRKSALADKLQPPRLSNRGH